MQPLDLITACLRQLRLRPLESAIIVLVVALAVGIETVMLAVVFNKLDQQSALSQSVEARSFVVGTSSSDYRSFYTSAGINPVFTIGNADQNAVALEEADLQKTLEACPALEYAFLADYSGIQEPSGGAAGARAPLVNLLAVSPAYIAATQLKLLAGSWPSTSDFRDRKRVIAISDWFARRRFGTAVSAAQPATAQGSTAEYSSKQVIGQTMRSVSGNSYTVVGVFATPQYVTAREEFRFVNEWQTQGVVGLMPWGIDDFSLSSLRELKFIAREGQFDQAREQLSRYWAKRFQSGVIVNAARDQITANLNASRSAVLITVLFASCGLLIAALNITNLMLARVLVRTRAIGISGALGASSRTIFEAFLLESLLLGVAGSLLGVLFAFGIGAGLEATLNAGASLRTRVDLTLHPAHFAFGLSIALVICLIFGAYPAWIASRIRPAEALRG